MRVLVATCLVLALALSFVSTESRAGEPCYPDLPDPVLVFTGFEDTGSAIRFFLDVSNRDVFPKELFELRGDLGPCGQNTTPSRTWVDIYDQSGTRLFGFCAIDHPSGLQNLWFAAADCDSAPEAVYITLTDRLCNIVYTSNLVNVGCCYPGLPSPELEHVGIEDQGEVIRFLLSVTNWSDYPPEMFELRGDLGPCGENPMPSRTWVDIYDQKDNFLFGFCALTDPSQLQNLWFARTCEAAPESVYITLTDRLCDIVYTSNLVDIQCAVSVDDASWGGIKGKYLK